ncbi:MAG TPA: tetratricopeptide repeat protein, partial [Rhizomicrobium sp.]|nr:tetratricopeptide repeat protein [Rhizomicrobium sp.]
MPLSSPSIAVQQVLAAAAQALQAGNLVTAEMALAPFFNGRLTAHPDLLNIAGTLRMNQGRLGEAVALFQQAVKAAPDESTFTFNLGLTLSRLGRSDEAQAALRATLKQKTGFVPALFELGALLHRTGRLDEAAECIRQVLRQVPGDAHAALAL